MGKDLELYQVDLRAKIANNLSGILSTEEQSFAQTIRNEIFKTQYIVVRVSLRQILANYLSQAADRINIAKAVHGKPYLVDYPEIQFNISHSGSFLLVAIGQIGAVGVDIEQIKSHRHDFSGLVAKCFADSEQSYWNALPEAEQTAEFYRFWTRKEAFVKAVGRGLAMGLQECVIVSGASPHFLSIPETYGQPSDWRIFDLSLATDLHGALVVKSKQIFTCPNIVLFDANQ